MTALLLLRGLRGRRRRSGRSATRGRALLDLLARVALEGPGRGELAELVADHVLRDVDRDELLPVVDRQCVPDHVREDRRAAGPRLQHALVARAVELRDLLHEVPVDERAFLCPSRHGATLPLPAATSCCDA